VPIASDSSLRGVRDHGQERCHPAKRISGSGWRVQVRIHHHIAAPRFVAMAVYNAGSEPGKTHSRARLRDLDLAWLRTRSGRSALACGGARNLDGIDGHAPRPAWPSKEARVACTFEDRQNARGRRLTPQSTARLHRLRTLLWGVAILLEQQPRVRGHPFPAALRAISDGWGLARLDGSRARAAIACRSNAPAWVAFRQAPRA
jgi:hypothetical protein